MPFLSDPQSPAFARTTGALYLLIAVAGGFSIAYVPGVLQVPDDPVASFANMLDHRVLFHLGITGDVVMMLTELLVASALFAMFRSVNLTLSFSAAMARFMMVAVMAAMLFFHAAGVALLDPAALYSSLDFGQRSELAGVMLQVHDAGVLIWQVFFTAHLLLLGGLVLASGFAPRLLGWGLMIGGLGYLADSVYVFAFPDSTILEAIRTALLVVVTLSELGFALWLLVRGQRVSQAMAGALHA